MPLSTSGCAWCQSKLHSFRNSLSLPWIELADFRAPLTSNLMLLESNRSSGKHETCLPPIYSSWRSSCNTRHDAHVITLLTRHRRTVFIVHRLRPNYLVNICGDSQEGSIPTKLLGPRFFRYGCMCTIRVWISVTTHGGRSIVIRLIVARMTRRLLVKALRCIERFFGNVECYLMSRGKLVRCAGWDWRIGLWITLLRCERDWIKIVEFRFLGLSCSIELMSWCYVLIQLLNLIFHYCELLIFLNFVWM